MLNYYLLCDTLSFLVIKTKGFDLLKGKKNNFHFPSAVILVQIQDRNISYILSFQNVN